MLVSAAPFFVFLSAVCLLYWIATGSRRLQLAVLVAANLFFLARFSLIYLVLPLAACTDYFIGLGLGQSERPAVRKALLGASLAINLGLLVGLKLVPLLTSGRFAWLFTLSLSFYCFQSLTYTIDLYLGEMQPTQTCLTYLASALFFPSITAGPIPRQGKLLAQFSKPFALRAEDGGRALLLIAIGLVKKLLIADYLANNLVGRVFDTPALYSSVETLVGVYGYALQLFFDFSGYTDIAMGAALLLGIRLPENFRQPYLAVNVAEFWRRWHITFSEWLRDYVFDPLPKRRKHPLISYSYAFLITFTLGGLWHGISWNFLIWGMLHGLALGVVFAWKLRRKIPTPYWWAKGLGILLTFHFVCFTWIFFRASSLENALAILRSLGALTWSTENLTPLVLGVLAIAAVIHCFPPRWYEISAGVAARTPFWVQGLAMAALILMIQTLAGRGSAPFVYGNF
ncbi:MAG: MBOAT family O-acyltransferase [Terracidiphilus sp.]|jgi:D-alanyl-lipoteichoic acid acyltransferase DltB (MBOAT superfamily)